MFTDTRQLLSTVYRKPVASMDVISSGLMIGNGCVRVFKMSV